MKKNVRKMSKLVFFSILLISLFFIDGFYFKKVVPKAWSTLIKDAEYKFYDFQIRKLSSDIKVQETELARKVYEKEIVLESEIFKESFDDLAVSLKASKEIVMVAIDEKSLTSFGAWPFKRSYYADFLKNVFEKGKARGVVFDIVFAEKGDTATIDALRDIKKKVNQTMGEDIDLTIERLSYNNKLEKAFSQYRFKIVAGYSTLSDLEVGTKDFTNVYFPPEAINYHTYYEEFEHKLSEAEIATKDARTKLQKFKGGIFNYDTIRAVSRFRGYFSVETDSDGNIRGHDPLRMYPIKTFDPETGKKTKESVEVFPSLSLSVYNMLRGALKAPMMQGEIIQLTGLETYIPNSSVRSSLKARVIEAIQALQGISDFQRKMLLKASDKMEIMAYEKQPDLSRFLALFASGDLDKMEGDYSGFLVGVRGIKNDALRNVLLSEVPPKKLKGFLKANEAKEIASYKADFEKSHKNLSKNLVEVLKRECLSIIKQEITPLFAFRGAEKGRVLGLVMKSLKIDETFIKAHFQESNLEKTTSTITLNEDGRLFIQFKGGVNSYLRYSMVDVIKGEDLSASLLNYQTPKMTMLEAFEDKVVLLGPTALGINDWRSTPVSSQLDGVELHAEIIDNLLDKSYILRTIAVRVMEIGMILLVALILPFVIRRVNASFGALMTIAFVTSYFSFAKYMFQEKHLYFQFLPIPLIALSLYLFLATYEYIQEEKKKNTKRKEEEK
ncbi:CHASE2 domain-containing protein, partial [bacterium]|nr:CHASE2 domain-containing protein [bacterium]